MHTQELYYALVRTSQREAEERARVHRIAKQARKARRTSASTRQGRQRRPIRRLRPVGEAA